MAEFLRKICVNGTIILVDMRTGDYVSEENVINPPVIVTNVFPVSNVLNIGFIGDDFTVYLETEGKRDNIIVNYIKAKRVFNVPKYDPRLIIKSILEHPRYKHLFVSDTKPFRGLMPSPDNSSDEDERVSSATSRYYNNVHNRNSLDIMRNPQFVAMLRKLVKKEVEKAILDIPLNIVVQPPTVEQRETNIVPEDIKFDDIDPKEETTVATNGEDVEMLDGEITITSLENDIRQMEMNRNDGTTSLESDARRRELFNLFSAYV